MRREDDRFVEANVCCTDRIVCASADSAAALETRLALYAANAFRYSFLAASVFLLYTCFCSSPRPSHIDATILETSPKVAFGFCPLMAACVSRKNSAYADTGFCGSLGSFFFFFFGVFGFLPESGAALFSAIPLFDSSASSSLIELDGEGVADLLAGGDGEV